MRRSFSDELVIVLQTGADSLRSARLPGTLAEAMERLAGQVHEPCILAVVGRMKAGKSTFINALLGEDVAKVGVTETTATINHFRYGTPTDPLRPIRCYWQGGRCEDVGRDFLDSLQGNDIESLHRAAGINHLEYHLSNAFLRDVTLVDTPGTAAVVDEHQNRTADFLSLQKQLRERNNQETERIGGKADAVIYLVGPVARANDQAFLAEFSQATGGRTRALNAIGVMAKIDLQPEILDRKNDLAKKIGEQLKSSLNTVVPVSAGIHQSLCRLRGGGDQELVCLATKLRQIPPQRLQKILDNHDFYEMDFPDCPVSVEERRQLLGDMPWTVFTTIARTMANPKLSKVAILQELNQLAGFTPLQEVLERHFFKRAKFLRCYRVLADARKVLGEIRYRHLADLRKKDSADKSQREKFVQFIRSADGDPVIARELENFVSIQLGTAARADRGEMILKDLDHKLAKLYHDMDEYNADFESLEHLEKITSLFSGAELHELRCLLGLYGLEIEKRLPVGRANINFAAARQQAWSEVSMSARDAARRRLAERAVARYGLILHELTAGHAGGE